MGLASGTASASIWYWSRLMGQISCRLASSVHFLPVAAGLLESSTLFVSVICISMHQEFWYRGSSLIPCEGSGYISVIACPLTFHLLHNFTWILLKHMYMLKGNDGFFSNIFCLLKVVEIIFIARPILKSKTSFLSAAVFNLTAWHFCMSPCMVDCH